mgnify:FL=1
MKYSQEIYTQQISWLRALKLETKQRLSSTLSFTAQEIQKSEASLEELQRTAKDLKRSSYEIRQLLVDYENRLEWLLEEVMFLDWMEDEWQSGQNMLH